MKNGKATKKTRLRPIWVAPNDPKTVRIIDQRHLPHGLTIKKISTANQMAEAIKEMLVRGAPLIGISAAYGIYLALLRASKKNQTPRYLDQIAKKFLQTRPTAVNLSCAVQRVLDSVRNRQDWGDKITGALEVAQKMAQEDAKMCEQMGRHGVKLIRKIYDRKGKKEPVRILTHCNAGWLACVQWGTATSPVYRANIEKIPVHVWVDETRPRNQGASLTAWELGQSGIPHTVIADNTGGHLMQHGLVDLVFVGADRVTRNGDVANKIGTYLKALAAKDNSVPFYAVFPATTIDWNLTDGIREIPIEKRDPNEVKYVQGLCRGKIERVLITPPKSPAENYGFDVTPGRLITGLITERGICKPSEKGLLALYPEHAKCLK